MYRKRTLSIAAIALSVIAAWPARAEPARAEDVVKIGVLEAMTGQQRSTGVQSLAAIRLYLQQHGDTAASKKIELIVRDDAAIPENTKRLAQELIINDKVNFLMGFAITPAALAVAPVATEAKVPMIVVNAGTSIITERSPYVARTSFTLAQSSTIIAEWALQNGIKKVVSIVSHYAPGIDAEKYFNETFTKGGGQVLELMRLPFVTPDFAPFLQRVRDAKPDAVYIFVPSGQGGPFLKQFIGRGLYKAGIRLIGPGDVTDDLEPRHHDLEH